MEAERQFYEANKNSQYYSPLITDKKGRAVKPTLNHLVAAANEFARRFPFRTVEEEEEVFSESELPSERAPFFWWL